MFVERKTFKNLFNAYNTSKELWGGYPNGPESTNSVLISVPLVGFAHTLSSKAADNPLRI